MNSTLIKVLARLSFFNFKRNLFFYIPLNISRNLKYLYTFKFKFF
ncbi:hypothetical protein MgSA37_00616 [Mucilaginibacter gotjawali]|uniref:Uncharacterized protein n=2 Tax=Mucilaginibacter gotjawali TaxID=1550579 RepID=A0A120MY32_9SPHI|nr:hypothetical protein [Mucilaginibacter gotjawali]BAU52455.1 hypothetical protein MgSA37_00616 [Mucilaginibacter gotjawali]